MTLTHKKYYYPDENSKEMIQVSSILGQEINTGRYLEAINPSKNYSKNCWFALLSLME